MNIENSQKPGKLGSFVALALYGIFALGPLQWYNIPLSENIRAFVKIGVPLASLTIAYFFRQNSRFRDYWKVFFAFFIGGTAFLLQWLVFQFITFPITRESIALEKLTAALLIIVPIIVMTNLSGENMGSIYIQKEKTRLGLLVGGAAFTFFIIFAVPAATLLFNAPNINLSVILGWAPWILVFVFSNAFLEEIMYRALFLKKYELLFGVRLSNVLQSIIFCSIHLSVSYTPEPFLFVTLTLVLGLVWGYLMQRTDSLIGSVLFHAGSDIIVIIQIFSALVL